MRIFVFVPKPICPMKKFLLLILVAGLIFPYPASACYTIVAGKKSTADGAVLFAHNEDDSGIQLMNFWQVPRQHFSPGAVVTLKRGGTLPQVGQTWAFSWIQDVHQEYSDFYINEWGVTLASNACDSKIEHPEVTDGGIGYMLRRIVAQRARTAREGVKIAGALLDKFGYAAGPHSGRTLVIADKNEAWLLDILPGKYWVAERVPDDAVVLQPNIYVIRKVDFQDTVNFIFSKKDIRRYAIKNGWYNPKKDKTFDFSYVFSEFRARHFDERGFDTRQWRGQQLLSGKTVTVKEAKKSGLPFSVLPSHKLRPADLMRVLRDHYEGTPYDMTLNKKGNPNKGSERTICTLSTQVSLVVQLRNGYPKALGPVLWLSFGRPDVNTYVPFYPVAANPPACYHYFPQNNDWQTALAHQFTPLPGTFTYRSDKAFWIFNDLENISGLNYFKTVGMIQKIWKKQEKQALIWQPAIEKSALTLYKTSPEKAILFLQEYSNARALQALKTSKQLLIDVKSLIYR
jgi:dipeptidase